MSLTDFEDPIFRAIWSSVDSAFYRSNYPDVAAAGVDPVRHYVDYGWREGRDPNDWFCTLFYVSRYADVRVSGSNPLQHWLEVGYVEGRRIRPPRDERSGRTFLEDVRAVRGELDREFYARQLLEKRVSTDHLDFAAHYLAQGVELGIDPATWFSSDWYLQSHTDVAAAGVNPFLHFILQGRREGRLAATLESRQRTESDAATPPSTSESHNAEQSALVGSEFNSAYYLATNPDIVASGLDPLLHFMETGWREGRDPNHLFSVSSYLELNPDVREAGINPFAHYLAHGRREGRIGKPTLGFRYEVIMNSSPLLEKVQSARKRPATERSYNSSTIGEALQGLPRSGGERVFLSVSHDNFTENFGGVQLMLTREADALQAQGYDHIHLFPALPLPVVEVEDPDPLTGMLINGQAAGFFRASDIAEQISAALPFPAYRREFAIHSLLGHNPERLVDIANATGATAGWFWLHDYASVCTNYTLMRNDVEFCGGPPLSSLACNVCRYGSSRSAQIEAHRLLFDQLNLGLIAPSQVALRTWCQSVEFPVREMRVHEHIQFTGGAQARRRRDANCSEPLRIGFLGLPVVHKGWPAFRELALKFGGDPRYSFFHLGREPEAGLPVTFEEVVVGPGALNDMVEAVRRMEIDIALLWSLWPETFCITAYEAAAGGAAIVTHSDSGNIATMVKANNLGAVLSSERGLEALFETGEIAAISAATAGAEMDLDFSNSTADFMSVRDR